MPTPVHATDPKSLLEGNRALAIDPESVERALSDLLERLSLPQRIHEIRGLQPQSIDGLYHCGGDEGLGIPAYKMVDGPRGVRAGKATAFPVAMARGASFDPELEKRVGVAMGREAAALGANVLLSPTINLLRHPAWGRAQETYSEDPHHMGAMAVAYVSGVQNHVLACLKHFALNNLEMTRFSLSAEIDPRTLHEVYLPHFRRCVVEAGAGSVMSAYNRVNGTYCGEHRELLTDILRDQWGFRGFVVSDWFLGTRSTAEALHAGLDIEMPFGHRRSDEKIAEALADGSLDEQAIERAARNALRPKLGWRLAEAQPPDASVIECDEHLALAREVAEKSLVLLKNEGVVLPLADTPGLKIAVVGDLAATANLGDRGSSYVTPSEASTPLAGLQELARQAKVEHFGDADDLSRLGDFDVTIVVAGLSYRDEGEFIPTAQLETEEGELARGGDRETLELPAPQRALIERAAAVARKTVVVLEGGSAIEVHPWIDAVEALVMAWYPGCEGGRALARVLFGAANPSGRLPCSFPRRTDQLMDWDLATESVPHDLLHGYRWLDHHGHEPGFPFGFGLSYTRFALSELRVERAGDRFAVTLRVANIGDRAGATVPQLYVSTEGSAVFRVPKELKAFARVELAPGESLDLLFELPDAELCYYDVGSSEFRLEPCRYQLLLGDSASDLPLSEAWQFNGPGAQGGPGAPNEAGWERVETSV